MPFLLLKRLYEPTLNEHGVDMGDAVVEEVIDVCVHVDGNRFARAAVHDGFLIVGKVKACAFELYNVSSGVLARREDEIILYSLSRQSTDADSRYSSRSLLRIWLLSAGMLMSSFVTSL